MGTADSVAELIEEQKGEVLVVRIKGRLDAVSSPIAEKKVFDAINNGNHKVILELGGVVYVSSAGMRMLLSTTKKIRSLSGKLCICSMTPNVMDVLKMSGFDHILDLYSGEEDALKHF